MHWYSDLGLWISLSISLLILSGTSFVLLSQWPCTSCTTSGFYPWKWFLAVQSSMLRLWSSSQTISPHTWTNVVPHHPYPSHGTRVISGTILIHHPWCEPMLFHICPLDWLLRFGDLGIDILPSEVVLTSSTSLVIYLLSCPTLISTPITMMFVVLSSWLQMCKGGAYEVTQVWAMG